MKRAASSSAAWLSRIAVRRPPALRIGTQGSAMFDARNAKIHRLARARTEMAVLASACGAGRAPGRRRTA
jgi:hypothetical protein